MNNLPVIPTPLFPRYIWMEEVTYSHIPIATLITAFMVLAPIIEYVGYRKKDMRYDRFARSLIWFSMILFSPGAALGTGIPMIIIGLYPEFWARWAGLFFGPLLLQFVFFLIEVVFLFFLYYLVWDRWQGKKKKLHMWMGVCAATTGLVIQFVWDGVGAYMTTPNGVALPGALESTIWNAKAFFNPSLWPLFTHRFFGNISYTMLLTGGVFAMKYMRAKDPKEHEYFKFSSDLAFSIGFISFFAMPFVGWWFAKVYQAEAPVAYNAIMGGHTATYFNIKLISIAFFVTVGSMYTFIRHREKKILLYILSGLLGTLWIVLTMHPDFHWLPGGVVVWRITYTIVIGGFIAFLWYLRSTKEWSYSQNKKGWPRIMLVAGLAAFLAFFMGGNARERARQPHSVYGQLAKPEVQDYETARFLVYDKCLPDGRTVRELKEMDFAEMADEEILGELCDSDDLTEGQATLVVQALRGGRL